MAMMKPQMIIIIIQLFLHLRTRLQLNRKNLSRLQSLRLRNQKKIYHTIQHHTKIYHAIPYHTIPYYTIALDKKTLYVPVCFKNVRKESSFGILLIWRICLWYLAKATATIVPSLLHEESLQLLWSWNHICDLIWELFYWFVLWENWYLVQFSFDFRLMHLIIV